MPVLVLEDIPTDIYQRLQAQAAARKRSLPEETLRVIREGLGWERLPSPRLPELVLSEEIPAPCDLPRSSTPEHVPVHEGGPRLLYIPTPEDPS